jgi:CheY-like chemotaxis protein
MVLEREGCVVEQAEDGIEAVLKLGLGEFDAIILDLMMPNLDGFAFIDTLQQNDPARLKRIIVTSAASPAVIRDRLRGEPYAVLPKPFEIRDLVSKVKEVIAQSR